MLCMSNHADYDVTPVLSPQFKVECPAPHAWGMRTADVLMLFKLHYEM